MTIPQAILYLLLGAACASVVALLITRNIFYAALSLLACVLSLAAIYALLGAEFLFITQIVIYAGGVILLILFGIMLTNKASRASIKKESQYSLPGIILAVAVFSLLVYCFGASSEILSPTEVGESPSHINQVGVELLTTYSAPFELSGVLLLVCLIGAALTAFSFRKELK